MSLFEKAMTRVKLVRQSGRERAMVLGHTATTTISEADRMSLIEVSGVTGERIIVIPNGVSAEAMAVGNCARQHDQSVIFWGNLDFPPNWTAVEYFFDKVFLPYLADKGMTWHIVGGGESSTLREKVQHPQVIFHGFVDDLYSFAAQKGVMVNPMVEGSGLKNKVLESLAIGVPVVSTALGVEAIHGEAGRHYLVSESPSQFAKDVSELIENRELRQSIIDNGKRLVASTYSWPTIGRQYCDLVESTIGLG
jgi:glycosyltransferase involved in cell wall biosynthesis